MGLKGPRVGKLAASGDVEGLIALLGPLDKRDVKARHALIGIGADAVPALLACALHDDPEGAGELTARAAAAHTVLVEIGEPALRAVERVVRTSDDAREVAGAAALLRQTAQKLQRPVADDLKREVERKTGATWAAVTGDSGQRDEAPGREPGGAPA